MKSLEESYTVLVIPSPASKTYRYQLTQKALKIIIGGTATVAVMLFVFLVHYFIMASDMWELKALRKETNAQKIQIQIFASNITDLKKQMNRLKDFDTKLRVIADIGPPPPSDQLQGMGGQEEPGRDAVYLGRTIQEEDLMKMNEDLKNLAAAASSQEVSFEELSEEMKDKRSLWASTPSVWPLRGWFTSGFGNRLSPFTGNVTMHNGIDIAARRDTPVLSSAGGVVSFEGFNSGFGKMVKLNHGYGVQTTYGHLSRSNVRIGQKIKRGDVIGFVGNTGLSTGPHLHYEILVNSIPVNPMRYILN
ncbi:MAG TPA: M23 family metallopeptidase [Nitrospiria bacterium]